MRKSLFAILVGTTLFGCAKKDAAAPSAEVKAAEKAMKDEGDVATRAPAIEGKTGAAKLEAKPGVGGGERGASGGAAAGSAAMAEPARTDEKGIAASKDAPATRDRMAAPAPAASIRAGEWDDNANYRDYAKWLEQAPRSIAQLDIRDREFIVVKDKDGKPVPNCTIDVTSGQQTTKLVTMASGRALWFPHAYGASGDATATATCGQNPAVTAKLAGKLDGIVQLTLAAARDLPARRTIDLAFVLDTTGSMREEIEAVKQTIKTVADQLSNDQTDVRIGLVEYKDRHDEVISKVYPFSSDLNGFSRSVSGLSAGGGGDIPEDMQRGLADALDKLSWRSDAVSRMVVVIADAPPHLDYQDERTFGESARIAASKGIKLFTVSASGMDTTGQIVMRQMAQFTGASNMFVLRGGAGPQSTGGGDPLSSCGGTQDQYASGKLDMLILGKIRRELLAVDADPMRIAGIGKDEMSKPCNERIVMAY